jgi:hypothetical protein
VVLERPDIVGQALRPGQAVEIGHDQRQLRAGIDGRGAGRWKSPVAASTNSGLLDSRLLAMVAPVPKLPIDDCPTRLYSMSALVP